MAPDTGDEVGFEATIRDGHTILTITGQRDVAVIVQSRSGERIYLPPEDTVGTAEREFAGGPYQPGVGGETDTGESSDSETPYDRAGGLGMGESGRLSGSRIVHPEPATDIRLLR